MSEVAGLLDELKSGRMSAEQVADRFRSRVWPAGRPAAVTFEDVATADMGDPEPDLDDGFGDVAAAYAAGDLTDDDYALLAQAAADAMAGRVATPETKGVPPISTGSYVSWPGGRGRVDMIVTSGTVPGADGNMAGSKDSPAARVVVWEKGDDGWAPTTRKVAVRLADLKRMPPLRFVAAESKDARLVRLAADHEERIAALGLPAYANPGAKAILAVYERGLAAWPGETKTALSRQDWASGRVEAFLDLAADGPTLPGYLRDTDLLPPGHPALSDSTIGRKLGERPGETGDALMSAPETKVGPKGYVHNWIFVGAPGVGDHVFHPGFGAGIVTHTGGGQVHVKFAGGAEHAFEHRAEPGPGRFHPREGGKATHAAGQLAEHAPATRALANDVRAHTGRSSMLSHAADQLDQAAGHMEAGRDAEAQHALLRGRRAIGAHIEQEHGYLRTSEGQHARTLEARARGIEDAARAQYRQRDSTGQELRRGDAVEVHSGPHAGMRGTVSDATGPLATVFPHGGKAGDARMVEPQHARREKPPVPETPRAGGVEQTPTGEIHRPGGEWPALSKAERGTANEPDEKATAALDKVLRDTMGTNRLNGEERVRTMNARDAFARGDYATAADEMAQARNSMVTRSAEGNTQNWAERVWRHADQRRGNQDRVAYSRGEADLFSRESRDPKLIDRIMRQTQRDAERRQQAEQRAVEQAQRTTASERRAVETMRETEQHARQSEAARRAGFGAGGGTDWKASTLMGRYSEHRTFNGQSLSISHTPNDVYKVHVGDKYVGYRRTADDAKRLAEDRARGVAGGGRSSRAEREKAPVIGPATGERLVSDTRPETNEHLDNAGKALAAGDNATAANHLGAALMSASTLGLRKQIENQRAGLLGGKQKPPAKGERRVIAEGEHQGVQWRATETNPTGIGSNRGYELSYRGRTSNQLQQGRTPHEAAARFKQESDAAIKKANLANQPHRPGSPVIPGSPEAFRQEGLRQVRRDAHRAAMNPLGYGEVQRAWSAAHGGKQPPMSEIRRWAYNGASETDFRSKWYQDALRGMTGTPTSQEAHNLADQVEKAGAPTEAVNHLRAAAAHFSQRHDLAGRTSLQYAHDALTKPGSVGIGERAQRMQPHAAQVRDLSERSIGRPKAAAPAVEPAAEPAKRTDYWVTARVKKTTRTVGGPVGPEHVGETFVPYDDRRMSEAAAKESALVSNDMYRPHVHGRTHVAVHVEPIPGTNRVRNLQHPKNRRRGG